jgi:hypothetical protein
MSASTTPERESMGKSKYVATVECANASKRDRTLRCGWRGERVGQVDRDAWFDRKFLQKCPTCGTHTVLSDDAMQSAVNEIFKL